MRKNYLLGDSFYVSDTEAFDNWIERITGERPKWEPIRVPLMKMSDIKPIILTKEDCEKGKFQFAVPNVDRYERNESGEDGVV